MFTNNGFNTVYDTGKCPFDHMFFFAPTSLPVAVLLVLVFLPGMDDKYETLGSYFAKTL